MATVDHRLKLTLEHLLEMSGGYVLDFSNASFATFVRDSIGVDPYSIHSGSKAQVLRHLWSVLADADFAKLGLRQPDGHGCPAFQYPTDSPRR